MSNSDRLVRLKDYLGYSRAYLDASRLLSEHRGSLTTYPDATDLPARVFRNGPVFNNLALAAELGFKTAIFLQKNQVQRGHDLLVLFDRVKTFRDVTELENRAKEAAILVDPPEGLFQRMESNGDNPMLWFEWRTHLGGLNDNYDSFRSRGPIGPSSNTEKFRTRYPPQQRNFKEVCLPPIIAGLEQLLRELYTDIARMERKT